MAKKPDPGLCTSNDGRFLKGYKIIIFDNYENLLFCFHTFGARRNIDVLDPENQSGFESEAPWLTGDSKVWGTISMKTKKKA